MRIEVTYIQESPPILSNFCGAPPPMYWIRINYMNYTSEEDLIFPSFLKWSGVNEV